MNILCIICARKGSKGIKNKNLRVLHGKPLIFYTLEIAKKSKIFNKIIISTDSKRNYEIFQKNLLTMLLKDPKKLASDKVAKLLAIKARLGESEFFNTKFDIIFDLDVTSPLREIKDIRNAKKKFIRKKYNSLISVCHSRKNPYFNIVEKTKSGIELVKFIKNYDRRQDIPEVFDVNASIYIWKRQALIKSKKIVNNHTGIFIMPKSRSIDIDDKFDFDVVKKLMKKINMRNINNF